MSDPYRLPPLWRGVLECRSTRDKIAIPIKHAYSPVESFPAIAAMLDQGYLTLLDRATFRWTISVGGGLPKTEPIECDIYQLTSLGIALCERHGIKQR